jgi:hypothetical protein
MRFIRLSADSSLQLLIAVRFPSDPARLAGRLPLPAPGITVFREIRPLAVCLVVREFVAGSLLDYDC